MIASDAPLADQRSKFEVDDDVAYLNTAALSPRLHGVRIAGEEGLARWARPWSLTTREWFDDVEMLRSRVVQLMGAAPGSVALIPATSYGLATVTRNLSAGPGDRVLVLGGEFPSSHHTWRRFADRTGADLVHVDREPGQAWTDAIVAAIDERVVVGCVPNVHWTNGALVDLDAVGVALRAAGAAFVIDASQSLGAMPLDVAALRPDALVSVGYKWQLGPYSLGYLYLDPHLHDGEPLEENWIVRTRSEDFSGIADYEPEYRPGAQRFDVGERSNFVLTPMASAAIGQLLEWGVARVAATLRTRTDAIAAGAEALSLTVEPAASRAPHLIGVQLPRERAQTVAESLAASRVIVSVRGSSLRIAPHLHNNDRDIERLLAAIASAL